MSRAAVKKITVHPNAMTDSTAGVEHAVKLTNRNGGQLLERQRLHFRLPWCLRRDAAVAE